MDIQVVRMKTAGLGVKSESWRGTSSLCLTIGVYSMMMKNRLRAYPRLPVALRTTKDAIVGADKLRLRPPRGQSHTS